MFQNVMELKSVKGRWVLRFTVPQLQEHWILNSLCYKLPDLSYQELPDLSFERKMVKQKDW